MSKESKKVPFWKRQDNFNVIFVYGMIIVVFGIAFMLGAMNTYPHYETQLEKRLNAEALLDQCVEEVSYLNYREKMMDISLTILEHEFNLTGMIQELYKNDSTKEKYMQDVLEKMVTLEEVENEVRGRYYVGN